MRDTKARFKSKGIIFPLPSFAMIANSVILLLILLPWFYVGYKFCLIEKLYGLLNSLLFDYSKCNCQNLINGENKY